ncbi:DUF3263 domain-containing protein [Rothia nasimurium]|uniref:DUF3263 domain-containing protein n=1 Tax=Rothia nasimurium TaxID=85336 RepID=UPI001F3D236C|nr:DUF3263 domain-containing protein [Rothia nasimurium]
MSDLQAHPDNHPKEPAQPAASPSAPQGLTRTEQAILDLEKKRFKYQGSKEQAIGRVLGLTPVAYYQQLNALIDNPRAIAAEPALTARLRAQRDLTA